MTIAVRNIQQLREQAQLHPILERVSRAIVPLEPVLKISIVEPQHSAATPWLVLQAVGGEGLAVCCDELVPCATPLRRSLVYLHYARQIAEVFGGTGVFPLMISEMIRPPHEWCFFRIGVSSGEFECACAAKLHESGLWISEPRVRARPIVARMYGVIERIGDEQQVLLEISVVLPELGIAGRFIGAKDKAMSIHVDNVTTQEISERVKITIELGEIELELSDLIALRPGSVLDLGATRPIRCGLRIGATSVAQGELEPVDEGFKLQIISTL